MKPILIRRLSCLFLLTTLALAPSILPAQDQPSTKPIRRVPIHFGQVGLSPSQRERIYEIRTRNHQRIEALLQEIARLEASELTECEAVLTEAQRRLLAQRRSSSRSKKPTPSTNPQKTSS